MAGLVTIVDQLTLEPTILSEYIDRLAPRDVWGPILASESGVDPLTHVRNIIDCRGYVYTGVPFPGLNQLIPQSGNYATYGVPPQKQINGSIDIPEGSVLVSITATSLQSAGFDFRIFEKTANWDLHFGEFASNWMIGQYSTQLDPLLANTVDTTVGGRIVGQFFLNPPMIVGQKAQVTVSLTNRSQVYNICQVLLGFAVPGSYTNVQFAATEVDDGN